jgi:hypothetical protein
MRVVETIHSYTGAEDYGKLRLDELGLPVFDLFTARSASREIGYLMQQDAGQVLGTLLEGAMSARSSR